ncbi:hypothetical protein LDENG_00204470, partial [Lucifuga dentata]
KKKKKKVSSVTSWGPPEEQRRVEAEMGLREFWRNYKVLIVMGSSLEQLKFSVTLRGADMNSGHWLRRKWLWVAGGAFVTVHLVTWLMQSAMRSVARSEAELKRKAVLNQKVAED